MYKLGFYVPEANLESVKQALFDAGAGRVGVYDHCCWQVKGVGQFRPGPGANPHIGTVGEIEQLEEYRVEMVVQNSLIETVVEALKRAHPYEEVAFDVVGLHEF